MISSIAEQRPLRRAGRIRQAACHLILASLWLALGTAHGQDCAFVGNQLIGTVRVLTVPEGQEVDLTTLPNCNLEICQLTDIAVRPQNGEVFVSQLDGNRVWVVDPSGGDSPTSVPVASAPSDILFAPSGSVLYVISGATTEAVMVDPEAMSETGRFGLPSSPRGLAMTPSGATLVTTSRNQNAVFFLDPADGSVQRMADTGERPIAVALSPNGENAYVTSEDGTLTIVEVATGSVVDTVTVGMLPAAVAVHPNGETVYVANRGDGTVSVVTLATSAVDTISVGTTPVALGVTSNGILVVANLQSGSLSVIDTNNSNAVLDPIPTGVSPFALAVAPCPGTSAACTGDCTGDGMVAINELITGVNINLGNRQVGDCPAFDENDDGSVAISELIRGVRNSLEGCPS